MPRHSNLVRAMVAAALALTPLCATAQPAVAAPIVPIPDNAPIVPIPDNSDDPDNPDNPNSPTNNGAKDDEANDGAKPAPGAFPENDGALHISIQANEPLAAKKAASPVIIPAGN